ncbi:hypothetical protein HWE04_12810 [Herbaspirillum sp. C7C2]|uniref:hypothetical protein n=1 Tax=Herbaspirillum sp. C7C2 TaxID=2736666 RepID=UPI001F51F7AF|nr:hypothetical protein [Herbaspirillum sp. C7C2]MCI1014732.1 hypothetical protein [Herbaspirillum sp. C7C2]
MTACSRYDHEFLAAGQAKPFPAIADEAVASIDGAPVFVVWRTPLDEGKYHILRSLGERFLQCGERKSSGRSAQEARWTWSVAKAPTKLNVLQLSGTDVQERADEVNQMARPDA